MKTAAAILFLILLTGCQTTGETRQSAYYDVCSHLIYGGTEWAHCMQRAQILEQRQRFQESRAWFRAADQIGRWYD